MSLSLQHRLVLNFFLVSLVSMLVVAYIPLSSYNLVLEQENKKKLDETQTRIVRNMKSRTATAYMAASGMVDDASFVNNFRPQDSKSMEELAKLYPKYIKDSDDIQFIQCFEPLDCKALQPEAPVQSSRVPQVLQSDKFQDGTTHVLGYYHEVLDERRLRRGGIVLGKPFNEETLKSLIGTTDVEVQLVDVSDKNFLNYLPSKFKNDLVRDKQVVFLPEARGQGTDLYYQAVFIPVIDQNGDLTKIIDLRMEQPAALTAWTELTTHFLISILVGIVIALLTGYVVSRSISRPVRTLVSGVREAADGNLGQYIVSERDDEVGELAKNFNTMTERLRASLKQLHERARTIEEKNIMQQRTLDELTLMRDYMENILSSIKSGVITIDLNMNVTTANSAAAQILRIKHVPLGPARDVLDPALVQLGREGLSRGRTYSSHEIVLDRDEDRKVLDVSTSLLKDGPDTIGVVLSFKDLTEIKALEEQVQRQERLAALGQLSAGVAHEIRNPLGIIKGSAELLKKRFSHLPEEEGLTEFIIDEVKRLSKVVTNFLDFARPKSPMLQEMDINVLLNYTIDMVKHQPNAARYNIIRELAQYPLIVNVDREQFQQVFLNLILNGMDAMPDGGTIVIRSKTGHDNAPIVEIQDNGFGIPKNNLEKIFNPFFTTKEGGTGLGLSIVHNIVESHSARLKVSSAPGKGSLFRIVFPGDRQVRQMSSQAITEDIGK